MGKSCAQGHSYEKKWSQDLYTDSLTPETSTQTIKYVLVNIHIHSLTFNDNVAVRSNLKCICMKRLVEKIMMGLPW